MKHFKYDAGGNEEILAQSGRMRKGHPHPRRKIRQMDNRNCCNRKIISPVEKYNIIMDLKKIPKHIYGLNCHRIHTFEQSQEQVTMVTLDILFTQKLNCR